MKIYNKNEVEDLAIILKNDGIICVPTDTVFGLCVRVNSSKAFHKLADIKKRPSTKSFPVMCATIKQIKEIAVVDEKIEKIIQSFMPGPITIVLKKKINSVNNRDDKITDEVAIRLAPTKILEELINKVGRPIFMTSANESGEVPYTTFDEIKKIFRLWMEYWKEMFLLERVVLFWIVLLKKLLFKEKVLFR